MTESQPRGQLRLPMHPLPHCAGEPAFEAPTLADADQLDWVEEIRRQIAEARAERRARWARAEVLSRECRQ